jgi:hypothetical protein
MPARTFIYAVLILLPSLALAPTVAAAAPNARRIMSAWLFCVGKFLCAAPRRPAGNSVAVERHVSVELDKERKFLLTQRRLTI